MKTKKLRMSLDVIEIEWDGPYTLKQISKLNGPCDYGIYQIYGNHNIKGPETLLHIGQANKRKFNKRIEEHTGWIKDQYSHISIYVGRLGGVNDLEMKDWESFIDIAEKLLIYYCSPPYNSLNISYYGEIENHSIVVNLGKSNRVPQTVSTLWEESHYWDKDKKWIPFVE